MTSAKAAGSWVLGRMGVLAPIGGLAILTALTMGGCGPVDVTLDDINLSASGNQIGNGSGNGAGGGQSDGSSGEGGSTQSGGESAAETPTPQADGSTDTPDDAGGNAGGPNADGGDGQSGGAPHADAGSAQSVEGGDTVTLDGGASSDPDGDTLSFAWSQSAGPSVTLSSADASKATFVAPDVDADTALSFVLTVSDGIHSATAQVSVTVIPASSDARIVATWKDATGDMNIDINWRTPDGQQIDVERANWGRQGAETVTRPADLLTDGVHVLSLHTFGNGAATELEYRVRLPGFRFDVSQRVPANLLRVIGVEISGGVASPVFNGWLDVGDEGAAELTRVHSVEMLAAWRKASGDVNVDVALYKPDGGRVFGTEMPWIPQGFERITLPADVALENGTYRLDLSIAGGANYADVTLRVAVLDFEFDFDGKLQAGQHRVIGLDVTDGHAAVVFNEWLPVDDAAAGGVSGIQPFEVVCGWRDGSADVNVGVSLRQPDGRMMWGTAFGWDSGGFERIYLPAGLELEDGIYTIEFALHGDGRYAEVAFEAAAGDWSFGRVERLGGGATRTIQLQVTNGVVDELANTWDD